MIVEQGEGEVSLQVMVMCVWGQQEVEFSGRLFDPRANGGEVAASVCSL